LLGPFEEEEEGTGIASDVVEVQGIDPPPPSYMREDRLTSEKYTRKGLVSLFNKV